MDVPMSAIKNPMHPGEFLKEAYMKPEGWTIASLSRHLDVSESALSRLVNGKASVSVDMAIKLSDKLGRTAQSWLTMQMNYDLAQWDERDRWSKVKGATNA